LDWIWETIKLPVFLVRAHLRNIIDVCEYQENLRAFLEPFVFILRVCLNAVDEQRVSADQFGIRMEMTGIFWLATIVMAVVAFSFVALPLLKSNRKNALLVIAIALPLVAAGLYLNLGSPSLNANDESANRSAARSSIGTGDAANDKLDSVASMVEGLAKRLEENPDDGSSWLLLARSYKHLNRIEEATDAYEKAVALGQFNADLAALGTGEIDEAAPGAQIFGNVRLTAAARAIIKPGDTVFIFAKAVDGPPMPVAVLRRPAADLPVDFLLNDSQSMTADMKLSNFEQVTVTARITRSGDATVALQELEATSGSIRVADNQHLNLIIE
jgi:tetratricopeptide (TPR) repeat protein